MRLIITKYHGMNESEITIWMMIRMIVDRTINLAWVGFSSTNKEKQYNPAQNAVANKINNIVMIGPYRRRTDMIDLINSIISYYWPFVWFPMLLL